MNMELGKEYSCRSGQRVIVESVHKFDNVNSVTAGATHYGYARILPRGSLHAYWVDGPMAGKYYSSRRLTENIRRTGDEDDPRDLILLPTVSAYEWEQQGLFE